MNNNEQKLEENRFPFYAFFMSSVLAIGVTAGVSIIMYDIIGYYVIIIIVPLAFFLIFLISSFTKNAVKIYPQKKDV